MSYTEQLQEKVNSIQVAYDEAKKALEAMRLRAKMYDAAQVVIDAERPGEKVVEILISVDSATPLSAIYERAEAKLADAEQLKEAAKALVLKAEAELDNLRKQSATKIAYQIMFASRLTTNDGSFKIRPSAEWDENKTFDSITDAVRALDAKGLSLMVSKNFFYFIAEKEVAA